MTGVSLVITFSPAAKMQIAKLSFLFVFISVRLFDTVILVVDLGLNFQAYYRFQIVILGSKRKLPRRRKRFGSFQNRVSGEGLVDG